MQSVVMLDWHEPMGANGERGDNVPCGADGPERGAHLPDHPLAVGEGMELEAILELVVELEQDQHQHFQQHGSDEPPDDPDPSRMV